MMKELRIRCGQDRDVEILAHVNVAMARETEGRELKFDTVLAGVKNVLAKPEYGFYVIAEKEGEIVGSLLITKEWSDWNDGFYWWIQSVYVRPEFRRQGIYTKLYEFVKQKAGAQGNVRRLRLYVEEENVKAQTVYRNVGMEETTYRIFDEQIDR